MLSSDILQPSGSHSPSTKYNLTRPRVERLEQLDHTRHAVRRERLQVDDDLEVVREQDEDLEGGADGEELTALDGEVFPGIVLRRSSSRRGRT